MAVNLDALYKYKTSAPKYNFTPAAPVQSFEDWSKEYEKAKLMGGTENLSLLSGVQANTGGTTDGPSNKIIEGDKDSYTTGGGKKFNVGDYVGLAANLGNSLFQLYNSKKASENYIPVSVNYIPNTKGYIPAVTGLSAEQRNLNERNLASMLVAAKEVSSDPMANLAAKANAQKVVADARAQIGAQDAQIRQGQEAAQTQAILEDQRMNTQITAMNTDAVNSANAVNANNLQGLKEAHYMDKSNIIADITAKVVDSLSGWKQTAYLDEQKDYSDKESALLDSINFERTKALNANNAFDKKAATDNINEDSKRLNELRKNRKRYGNSLFS